MKIQIISLNEHVDPLAIFFQSIPTEFLSLIRSKFTRYQEYGDIIPCKSLKTLNPKIWKYKGLIYKLRIDCGQQSARILFTRSDHNLIILHGFLKTTRKTPARDAHLAIENLSNLNCAIDWI